MKTNTLTKDFKRIVLENIPLIDVRAPIEFEKGAFETSINLPIMNDKERHLVGTCYKKEGNEAATALGHRLVSGEVREARIQQWLDFIKAHPHTMVYCFRGGSRSRISQEWINARIDTPICRLEGGYKAFRTYLMEQLEATDKMATPIILGGYTGVGKTIVLKQLEQAIDLEYLANHRGSSFGRHVTPQPTQIAFENNLAYELIRYGEKGFKHMVLEDEGRHIGTSYIPKPLYNYFNTGKLVVIDATLDERVAITLKEYVIESQQEYIRSASSEEVGLNDWLTYIHKSIERVKKRLGGSRHKDLSALVDAAFTSQLSTGHYDSHSDWIGLFLKEYYDPMYQYQLEHTTKKIIFRGSSNEVLDYLKDYA